MTNPSILKRLAACFYELLLLIAIWLITAGVFIALFGDATHGLKRLFLQLLLWGLTGAYFVWCWKKTGQTLAMKTWKMQLVSQSGQPLSYAQLIMRYAFASIGLAAAGAGFWWMIFDREHLFLHDRLTGCRVISTADTEANAQ